MEKLPNKHNSADQQSLPNNPKQEGKSDKRLSLQGATRSRVKENGNQQDGMAITRWPQLERPTEKLIYQGADALSDAELLAVVLRSGTQRMSVLAIARWLLTEYGSLGALLSAEHKRLCLAPGLGVVKAAQIKALAALSQRLLKEAVVQKTYLRSSRQTRDYLRLRYQHNRREVFSCVFLNSQHGVIAMEELFVGSISQSHVYPREVLQRCLYHNAAAIILAHNHPSGESQASDADIVITKRLVDALALVDIRVLDHIIIGEQVTSLAEQGLI